MTGSLPARTARSIEGSSQYSETPRVRMDQQFADRGVVFTNDITHGGVLGPVLYLGRSLLR